MVQGSVINVAGHSLASDALKIIIELLCVHFIHVLVCVGRAHAPATPRLVGDVSSSYVMLLCYYSLHSH
jgi:hypothetical protein